MLNIETHFKLGRWVPAAKIERSFVKYANPKASPGEVWHRPSVTTPINLSVIIPTSDAHRGGYFMKLLAQIGCQDVKGFEVIVVRGDSRQGRAINVAAALAQGKYLVTLDDDTSLPDKQTFKKLLSIMEDHPEIGIAGGNNVVPAETNNLTRCVMEQVPRRSWEPVTEITISDLAEHPCMIMRTEEFKKVGGENELIPRGLDPYLREEFRELGKHVVVVPNVIYHHLPPDSLKLLFRQFFRNGLQSFFIRRNYPQWVIETPANHGLFKAYLLFPQKIMRFAFTLVKSLLMKKPILFICEIAYAVGFLCGMLSFKKPFEDV